MGRKSRLFALTGLATALGPGSRRYRVGAMLTLLRVPLFLVHGERFALALTFVSLEARPLAHIGVRDGAFISSHLRFQIFVSDNPSGTGPSAALKPRLAGLNLSGFHF
jgi:hypothetical protein